MVSVKRVKFKKNTIDQILNVSKGKFAEFIDGGHVFLNESVKKMKINTQRNTMQLN